MSFSRGGRKLLCSTHGSGPDDVTGLVSVLMEAWGCYKNPETRGKLQAPRQHVQMVLRRRRPATVGSTAPLPTLIVSKCAVKHPLRRTPTAYHGRADFVEKARIRSVGETAVSFLANALCSELGAARLLMICPEMDVLGMSCPRPPLRLVRAAQVPALRSSWQGQRLLLYNRDANCPIDTKDSLLLHPKMASFCDDEHQRVRVAVCAPQLDDAYVGEATTVRTYGADFSLSELIETSDLGVLKSRSPSCGLNDARLYNDESDLKNFTLTDGVFVQAIKCRSSANSTGAPLTLVSTRWDVSESSVDEAMRSALTKMMERFSRRDTP